VGWGVVGVVVVGGVVVVLERWGLRGKGIIWVK
jgi:hypothetical protein